MKKFFKVLGKVFAALTAVYGALFAIFYFDLDGKFLYKVWEPMMVRRYDAMERRNPLESPYEQVNNGKDYL